MEMRSGRILLRDFTETDVDALFAAHSDPRVMRYYAPEVGTVENAQMLVDLFIRWANESPRRNFQLAIVHAQTVSLIGSCGIRSKDCHSGHAEFGIGIHPEYWGRGLAQEAAKAMLGFGFSELNLAEIRGIAVSQNEAVAKFVRRLGFTPGIPRAGDQWMTQRGWSAVDWTLSRETWEHLAD